MANPTSKTLLPLSLRGYSGTVLKVGVTGGIGSGKSVVCRVFASLGIPVFNADNAAQYLMQHDEQLKHAIIRLLGDDAYNGDLPNKEIISSIIYKQPQMLHQLNALVHPATIAYGNAWIARQSTPYVIKEAAIFFESGTNKEMDVMIGVYAPRELRIQRAIQRSNITRDRVERIMAQQMDEEEKMNLCDYVIVNDDVTALLPQVLKLHIAP